jgi:hypothetical protein
MKVYSRQPETESVNSQDSVEQVDRMSRIQWPMREYKSPRQKSTQWELYDVYYKTQHLSNALEISLRTHDSIRIHKHFIPFDNE